MVPLDEVLGLSWQPGLFTQGRGHGLCPSAPSPELPGEALGSQDQLGRHSCRDLATPHTPLWADPGEQGRGREGGAGCGEPTLLFSCCSSIWMSVSLARSSSLAACSAARTSALSPLARLPMPFLDMVGGRGAPGAGRLSGLGCPRQAGAGVASLPLRYIFSLTCRESTPG